MYLCRAENIWPHYLPLEVTELFLIVVCIPPDANANKSLKWLHDKVKSLQNEQPGALKSPVTT